MRTTILIIAFSAFFYTDGKSQILDSFPFYKLDRISYMGLEFKTMTRNLYNGLSYRSNTYWVNDPVRYKEKFIRWEKALVEGQAGQLIARNIVESTMKANPGEGKETLIARHRIYHKEIVQGLRRT